MKRVILSTAITFITVITSVSAQSTKRFCGTPQDSLTITQLLSDIGNLYCNTSQEALSSASYCDTTVVNRNGEKIVCLVHTKTGTLIEKPKATRTCKCTWYKDEKMFFHGSPNQFVVKVNNGEFWFNMYSRYVSKDDQINESNNTEAIEVLQYVKERLEQLAKS
jgi:hypothetical protein